MWVQCCQVLVFSKHQKSKFKKNFKCWQPTKLKKNHNSMSQTKYTSHQLMTSTLSHEATWTKLKWKTGKTEGKPHVCYLAYKPSPLRSHSQRWEKGEINWVSVTWPRNNRASHSVPYWELEFQRLFAWVVQNKLSSK